MLGTMILALVLIAPTVFTYFLIVKTADRFEPEPWWLLTVMFFWGAVGATTVAIIGNGIGEAGVSLALSGDDVEKATASFVAPLVEESTKGFGLLCLWTLSALWLKEVDGPLDGAIYGGVVGLGFTMTEDVLYVTSAASKGGAVAFGVVFVIRTVMAGLGHASFTAMTGLGIGVAIESRSVLMKVIAPLGGWVCAVGLHFLHNFMVTYMFEGGVALLIKLVVFWAFDFLFFVLLFVLAARDRSIVLRGLVDEVGNLLHPKELQRTVSFLMLMPFWNLFSLLGSPGGYFSSRKKQLALVELAFVKHRRRRGETGSGIDTDEGALRQRIGQLNAQGVFVGAR